jgi:hypothetical protein
MEGEDREQKPLPATPDGDHLVADDDIEGAEDSNLQRRLPLGTRALIYAGASHLQAGVSGSKALPAITVR